LPEPRENLFEGRLSGVAFEKLLSALDSDRERAGEKYEKLHFKLRKFFAWKGCHSARIDALADDTLDRVAKNLAEGTIIENVNSYIRGVAKRVWLEQLKKPHEESLEEDPPDIATPETPAEEDKRYECLDRCLATLAPDDCELILGYYDAKENEKNKDKRKSLAERFGKSSGALKVQATRLRDRMERCITICLDAWNKV